MKTIRMLKNAALTEILFSRFYLSLLLMITVGFTTYPTFVLAADITGTNLPNTIDGTMDIDKIFGRDGEDNLFGSGGNDVIHGDDGNDNIVGDLGKDILEGNDGDDIIQGGSGEDEINGGKGNDTLLASFAIGSVSFRDYAADVIMCGPGFDTAYINPVDGDSTSQGCEVIIAETSQ
jgi:Ca2+-binding RTX toxin-like protein